MKQPMLGFWLGWPVPEEEQVEERSVLDPLMYRGSYVYTFGAEVRESWLRLGGRGHLGGSVR